MKARVIATGKIIEIVKIEDNLFIDSSCCQYEPYEIEWEINNPDYWTRLEHQYAGMAMQGILSNQTYTKHLLETSTSAKDARDIIVDASYYLAHALVEKYKKEEK